MHGTLHPSDYQLRKVSSEPNLKMRVKLRAKLLNKASSPLQSQNSAFTFTQRISQRFAFFFFKFDDRNPCSLHSNLNGMIFKFPILLAATRQWIPIMVAVHLMLIPPPDY